MLTNILDAKNQKYNLVKKAQLCIKRRDLEKEKRDFMREKMVQMGKEEEYKKWEEGQKKKEQESEKKGTSQPLPVPEDDSVLGRLARRFGISSLQEEQHNNTHTKKQKNANRCPLKIVAFEPFDHSVTTLTSDGVLCEWTLVSSQDEHGLNHIYRIEGVCIYICIIISIC